MYKTEELLAIHLTGETVSEIFDRLSPRAVKPNYYKIQPKGHERDVTYAHRKAGLV